MEAASSSGPRHNPCHRLRPRPFQALASESPESQSACGAPEPHEIPEWDAAVEPSANPFLARAPPLATIPPLATPMENLTPITYLNAAPQHGFRTYGIRGTRRSGLRAQPREMPLTRFLAGRASNRVFRAYLPETPSAMATTDSDNP